MLLPLIHTMRHSSVFGGRNSTVFLPFGPCSVGNAPTGAVTGLLGTLGRPWPETPPWLTMIVPGAVPALTRTSMVIVAVAPGTMLPRLTVGGAIEVTVPTLDVTVSTVVLAGTGSVNITLPACDEPLDVTINV